MKDAMQNGGMTSALACIATVGTPYLLDLFITASYIHVWWWKLSGCNFHAHQSL